jgi:hypothetical protein
MMALRTVDTLVTGLPRPSIQPASLPRVAYALALDPSEKFGSMEEQTVFLSERFREEETVRTDLHLRSGS